MAEWSRVVNTTISEHIRTVEENILRNRKLLALLKKKGRISFGHEGQNIDWRILFRRAPLTGYADVDTLTFPRRDRWKVATLDWRGYSTGESMTKKEKLMNKGTSAIVKIFSDLVTTLTDDLEDLFAEELFIDGNAAGNGKRIHGFESFLGKTASGTSAGAKVRTPSDTYAGLNTDLGNYGGTWTGNWPDGTGQPEYDFFSPVLVDVTATSGTPWGASPTFAAFGDIQIRWGMIKNRQNKYPGGAMDLVLLANDWYYSFLNLMSSKERIVIDRGKNASPMVSLGFSDVIQFDGMDVTWEYGMPASTGYGLSTGQMELMSLQDQLFVAEGPEYNQATKSHNVSVDYFGNMKFNPRGFVKWFAYT